MDRHCVAGIFSAGEDKRHRLAWQESVANFAAGKKSYWQMDIFASRHAITYLFLYLPLPAAYFRPSLASGRDLLLLPGFCMMAFIPDIQAFPSMQLREKAQIMTASEIDRTLVHLAHEIVEKTSGLEGLAQKIQQLCSLQIPVGTLDIQLYRDDLSPANSKPVVQPTQIPFPVAGKDVILVDDVLYTGRSSRAALDALFHHGRPRRVRICTLIDRGHRELPIEASFIGKRVTTTDEEIIEVKLQEEDQMEKVLVLEKVNPGAPS